MTNSAQICLECVALEVRVAMLETAILGSEQVEYGLPAQAAVEIIADACAMFDVSSEALLGSSRLARVCNGRFAAYWTIRVALKWSLPRVARSLRRKDHSSIMHGLSRAAELRERDKQFADRTNFMLAAHHERENERRPSL